MFKTDILKNGVRSTKHAVLCESHQNIQSPNYFGSGHFMLKKSEFPKEYELFKQLEKDNIWAMCCKMTDKDVKKSFKEKSGKLKLFEPSGYDDYPSVFDGDDRFNARYYWFLCKYLGCKLYFGDHMTPITIKKNNKIVGYAMGMRPN